MIRMQTHHVVENGCFREVTKVIAVGLFLAPSHLES